MKGAVMADSYLYIIAALVPISALMLVTQANPYRAIVIRGMLGAVAALLYTVLGAADVALTEALVGTLLVIMLYAVTIRSSLVFRLGMLGADNRPSAPDSERFREIVEALQPLFGRHHMRVAIVAYPDETALRRALAEKAVHAILTRTAAAASGAESPPRLAVHMTFRLRRVYDIARSGVAPEDMGMTCIEPTDSKEVDS
jgi:putative multicomponent Na+:H+ antiporter subunit B